MREIKYRSLAFLLRFITFCVFVLQCFTEWKEKRGLMTSFPCVSIDLSSRAASSQVLWAQTSLTSVFGMGTGGPSLLKTLTMNFVQVKEQRKMNRRMISKSSPSHRSISISQLNVLLRLHLWPIKLVVYKWPYWLNVKGYLILRHVSRLDAFSVYHFRTRLPGYALGRTTDAPEVRPTRSSRTKVSSSQISCAHDR